MCLESIHLSTLPPLQSYSPNHLERTIMIASYRVSLLPLLLSYSPFSTLHAAASVAFRSIIHLLKILQWLSCIGLQGPAWLTFPTFPLTHYGQPHWSFSSSATPTFLLSPAPSSPNCMAGCSHSKSHLKCYFLVETFMDHPLQSTYLLRPTFIFLTALITHL